MYLRVFYNCSIIFKGFLQYDAALRENLNTQITNRLEARIEARVEARIDESNRRE